MKRRSGRTSRLGTLGVCQLFASSDVRKHVAFCSSVSRTYVRRWFNHKNADYAHDTANRQLCLLHGGKIERTVDRGSDTNVCRMYVALIELLDRVLIVLNNAKLSWI